MKDKEFDKYMEGDSELSQLYRHGASLEPPAEVDAAILAEARKALKPKVVSSPFASNWTVPLSLAAVLVLCVGLVLFVKEESGMLTTPEVSKTPLSDKLDGEAASRREELNNKAENVPLNRLDKTTPISKLSGKITTEGRSIKQNADKASTPPAPKKKVYGLADSASDSLSTTKDGSRYKKQPAQLRSRQVKEDIAKPAVEREQAMDKDIKAKAVEPKKSLIVNQKAEALLAKIRKLRKAGKNRKADRNLELFKRLYPNYPTGYPTDNTVTPAAKP